MHEKIISLLEENNSLLKNNKELRDKIKSSFNL